MEKKNFFPYTLFLTFFIRNRGSDSYYLIRRNVLDEDNLRHSVHLDNFNSLENVDRIVLQKLCPTKMYNSTQYRMLVNMPALMSTQVLRTESG